MPRTVFLVTLALCAVGAAMGLRLGWRYATLTETEVIDAAVTDYMAHEASLGHEASGKDCAARPGEGKLWVIVLCVSHSDPKAVRTEYYISRWGRMEKYRGG